MESMITLLSGFSDYYLVIARLVIGAVFLAHGWPKLRNLPMTWQNFSMMGFKPGMFWGTIVALIEVFGGLAIILGLGVQPAAFLLAINMIVAALWKKSRGQKLVGGFELDLALFSALLILAGVGAGAYSLDNYLAIAIY